MHLCLSWWFPACSSPPRIAQAHEKLAECERVSNVLRHMTARTKEQVASEERAVKAMQDVLAGTALL